MKFWEEICSSEKVTHHVPERNLWLAVIDRAIADYFIGDDLCIGYRRNLDSFFFDEVPKPCNLIYICELLFDEAQDVANLIRKKVLDALKNGAKWSEISIYTRRRFSVRTVCYRSRQIN